MTNNAKFTSDLKIEPMDEESNLKKCEEELLEKIFTNNEYRKNGDEDEGSLHHVLVVSNLNNRMFNQHDEITLDVDDFSDFFCPIDHKIIISTLEKVISIAESHHCKVGGKLAMMWDHNYFEDVEYFFIDSGKVYYRQTKSWIKKEMEKQKRKNEKMAKKNLSDNIIIHSSILSHKIRPTKAISKKLNKK